MKLILDYNQSNGYYAWKLRDAVENGELADYLNVRKFIKEHLLKFDYIQYMDYDKNNQIEYTKTEEIKSFLALAKRLHYKITNKFIKKSFNQYFSI